MKDTHRHLHASTYIHRHTGLHKGKHVQAHTHTQSRAAYLWGVVTATEQIRAC